MKNTYCAFLRGVNVKGTTMKMAEVCELFRSLGLEEVQAVLASGNLIFTSEWTRDDLKARLIKALSEHFDYEAFLFVRDRAEVVDALEGLPWTEDPAYHRYLFIGDEDASEILMERFKSCSSRAEGEDAAIVGSNFYWRISKGNTLASEFSKVMSSKALKSRFTSRNANTLFKVLEKM